jgi:HK97 family phage portal protein
MRWPWQSRRAEQRDVPLDQRPGTWALASGGWPTAAAVPVTTDSAQRSTAVWSCVRLLAETISSLPVDVYRQGDRNPIPKPPVLLSPAAGWAFPEWVEALMRSLLLSGNAYALVADRGPDLRPTQLELCHPDLVLVRYTPQGQLEYKLNGHVVPPGDMWHVRAFTMPGAPGGLSPIGYARQGVALGLAAELYGAELFGQGTLAGGILEVDHELTSEQAEALKQRWEIKVAGLVNAHRVAVLDQGAKFRPLQIPPQDAEFINTRKYQLGEIARLYGIPVEMVGGETGGSHTYISSEHRSIDYLRYCVSPWLVRLEGALSRLLPGGQSVKFNVNAILRSTTLERYQAHEIGIRAGFLTVNEARDLEDLPPLPGGDQPAALPPPPKQAAA